MKHVEKLINDRQEEMAKSREEEFEKMKLDRKNGLENAADLTTYPDKKEIDKFKRNLKNFKAKDKLTLTGRTVKTLAFMDVPPGGSLKSVFENSKVTTNMRCSTDSW